MTFSWRSPVPGSISPLSHNKSGLEGELIDSVEREGAQLNRSNPSPSAQRFAASRSFSCAASHFLQNPPF